MSGVTTKGLNETQLEALGRAAFGFNKLYNFAPHLMGMWLDSLFLGILLALFVRWQVNVAATDRGWVKGIVYYLIGLHLCMSSYILAYQIRQFVIGFGEYRSFLQPSWARPSFVFKACSRLPCSAFFTHRAWIMWKRNWAIPICIVPMFIASAGCAVCVTALYDSMPIPRTGQKLIWAMRAEVQGSLELATDLSLTTLLTVALLRSRTGFKQTDDLIGRIVRSLVETQLPPTLNAAAFLAVTVTLGSTSQTAYWLAGPKIYPICLLIVISSRVSMQTQHGSNGVYMQETIELTSTADGIKPDEIRVERTTETVVTLDDPTPSASRRVHQSSPSLSDVSIKSEKGEPYERDAKAWA